MSGKSTYIKQIALLQIMAQCGSFVPAQFASFSIKRTLYTRLNFNDEASGVSTFSAEMKDMANILSNATKDDLVLVDELGRGTSTMDAIGLAYACAEKLIALGCFVFFTTHMQDLAKALEFFANVTNLHLDVSVYFLLCPNDNFSFVKRKKKTIPSIQIQEKHSLHLRCSLEDE